MATQSSMVTPSTGTKGQTSVAPMRGWAPVWPAMSMSWAARAMPAKAARSTASGDPTKVTTVRLVSAPGSTLSRVTPAASMASVICLILARSRPSEKFGTHSTRAAGMLASRWEESYGPPRHVQNPHQGRHRRHGGGHVRGRRRDRRRQDRGDLRRRAPRPAGAVGHDHRRDGQVRPARRHRRPHAPRHAVRRHVVVRRLRDRARSPAAYGGTTCIVDFAIQTKGEPLRKGLDTWHAKAEGKAAVDYAFHMILTDVNDGTVAEMQQVRRRGRHVASRCSWPTPACSSSTTGRSSARCSAPARSARSSACTPRTGIPIDILVAAGPRQGPHRARSTTRSRARRSPRPKARTARSAWPRWPARPCTSCTCPPPRALEQVVEARDRGLPAFAETCPQYLFLSQDDLARPGFEGAKYVCTPPLRPREMQEDLWRGLRTHDLQVVSTDHCPFCMKGQKELGKDSFAKIPNGMPGVETRHVPAVGRRRPRGAHLDEPLRRDHAAPRPRRSSACTRARARSPWAPTPISLVWDGEKKHVLSDKTLHMRVDYTPYEGREVTGAPDARAVARQGRRAERQVPRQEGRRPLREARDVRADVS